MYGMPTVARNLSRLFAGRTYYALFGHNCWCCAEGSEVFVYTAPSPLGPWRFQSDINLRGNVSAGFGKLEVSAFSSNIVEREKG